MESAPPSLSSGHPGNNMKKKRRLDKTHRQGGIQEREDYMYDKTESRLKGGIVMDGYPSKGAARSVAYRRRFLPVAVRQASRDSRRLGKASWLAA